MLLKSLSNAVLIFESDINLSLLAHLSKKNAEILTTQLENYTASLIYTWTVTEQVCWPNEFFLIIKNSMYKENYSMKAVI